MPIIVGGTSPAALRRAATLGDGWHGIGRTPEEVAAAVAVMDQRGHRQDFRISLRTQMRVGGQAQDLEAPTALRGSADDLAEQVRRYADAGVGQLVLEPDAIELDDFLQQLTRFASEVARRFPQGLAGVSAP